MQPTKHIAIIGAGPCGLMAAETLASKGLGVTVYDRMPSPARKFLLAGRGGLNLTHSKPLPEFLASYGEAAAWLTPAINAFPPEALRQWCEGLGEETFVGSSGRIFPRSMKAAPLLRAWLKRLETLGVRYAPRHTWQGWEDDALRFTNEKNEVVLVRADATLLALGGASWPRLGADGGWVSVLSDGGIKVAPLRPANGGFIAPWSEHFSSRYAGSPLKSVVIFHQENTHHGEVMITEKGMEGGAIYALSASIREAIETHGTTTIELDIRPQMSLAALTQKLHAPRGNKSLSTYLRGLGFSPVIVGLLRETTPSEALSAMDAGALAARLKCLPITFTAHAGLARAISSAGGIMCSELTDDLMLRNRAGIFAAGEMLDWEAPTGGYLLQACFSTAVLASRGITNYCS